MLDGNDWVHDREWERLLFLKTQSADQAKDLWAYNYPHFKKPRIISVRRGSRKIKK